MSGRGIVSVYKSPNFKQNSLVEKGIFSIYLKIRILEIICNYDHGQNIWDKL